MTVHPLGVRTSVHTRGILAVWVQGLREGAECFTVDGLCKKKKKVYIRICELELLGQGGSEGREKREGGGESEKGKGGGQGEKERRWGQGEKEGQEDSAQGWSSPFCLTPSSFSCH